MSYWDHYHLPSTVDEALAYLARYPGTARLVAGGTDLLLEIQQGRKPRPEALVDITRIPDMTAIRADDGVLYIGAAVTHTAIIGSPLLAQQATCLIESCGVIGGPQVRNVATLGGNVAHALPAGDGTLSLVALDAEAEVAGPDGRLWRPVASLYSGPGKSALGPTEIIVQFRMRAADPAMGQASAFKRIMRPQGVALPILGMAVAVDMTDGLLERVRIAVGPAGPRPLRAAQAEALLSGKPFSADLLEQAIEAVLADARLRTSPHRATADYRQEMIGVLLRRSLSLAVRRAESGEVVPEGIGLG
jgi:CO/xanthine dehydrogenase FAD-binding subunit